MSEQHVEKRKLERGDLQFALAEAGACPPQQMPPAHANDAELNDLIISAHRFIAKMPSMLVAVRLADMTGEKRPTNIPSTSDAYPNWKPKLSVTL